MLAVGVALAGALGWFWLMSGRLEEAESWYAELLARRGRLTTAWRGPRCSTGQRCSCGGAATSLRPRRCEESAVGMFRSAGDSRWLSYGLALLARVRTGQERLDEARALLEEARAVWSQVKTTYGQPFDAYLRYYLGSAALVQGDADAARVHLESSLRDLEAAGDDMARGVVLGSLGLLAAQRGEHAEARARFAESLPLLRGGDDQWDLALLLLNAGLEEAQAASPAAAGGRCSPMRCRPGSSFAAPLAWRSRSPGWVRSRPAAGSRTAPASCSARAGRCSRPPTPCSHVIVPYDLPGRLAAARAAGDPAAFDRGLAEGQAWTIDRAVAAGLASAADPDADLK